MLPRFASARWLVVAGATAALLTALLWYLYFDLLLIDQLFRLWVVAVAATPLAKTPSVQVLTTELTSARWSIPVVSAGLVASALLLVALWRTRARTQQLKKVEQLASLNEGWDSAACRGPTWLAESLCVVSAVLVPVVTTVMISRARAEALSALRAFSPEASQSRRVVDAGYWVLRQWAEAWTGSMLSVPLAAAAAAVLCLTLGKRARLRTLAQAACELQGEPVAGPQPYRSWLQSDSALAKALRNPLRSPRALAAAAALAAALVTGPAAWGTARFAAAPSSCVGATGESAFACIESKLGQGPASLWIGFLITSCAVLLLTILLGIGTLPKRRAESVQAGSLESSGGSPTWAATGAWAACAALACGALLLFGRPLLAERSKLIPVDAASWSVVLDAQGFLADSPGDASGEVPRITIRRNRPTQTAQQNIAEWLKYLATLNAATHVQVRCSADGDLAELDALLRALERERPASSSTVTLVRSIAWTSPSLGRVFLPRVERLEVRNPPTPQSSLTAIHLRSDDPRYEVLPCLVSPYSRYCQEMRGFLQFEMCNYKGPDSCPPRELQDSCCQLPRGH